MHFTESNLVVYWVKTLSDLVFLVWLGMHLCAVEFLFYLLVERCSNPHRFPRGCANEKRLSFFHFVGGMCHYLSF